MRDIKFRAWDVESKEMTLPNDILEVLVSMKNEVYAMVKGRNETLGGINRDNTILMQYTGLKDKNGVEIYEGDIVKYYDFWDELTGGREKGQQRICRVEYVGSGFLVVQGDEDGYEQDLFMVKINDDDLEVIGNIYENPELLGEEDKERGFYYA